MNTKSPEIEAITDAAAEPLVAPLTPIVPLNLEIAKRYRSAGLSLVPINPNTKRPCGRHLPKDEDGRARWKIYQSQIVDEDTLSEWFASGLKSVAVVCGRVSCPNGEGGLLVLDFDEARFYHAWLQAVGVLALDLPVQRTGGGGYQVYCFCPNPGENAKLAWVTDEMEDSGRSIAIETRAEGGYAVLPHSLHPSGNRYQMLSGDLANIPMIPQAQADALVAAARKLDECPHTRQERAKFEEQARRQHQRKAVASRNGSASVIDAFNKAHEIERVLEQHGYTPCGDRYVRPGGESPSVSVKDGRSCHFSSNDPLNDGRVKSGVGVHDAFDVYAHYEHGGDVKAAVKAAARLLKIDPPAPVAGKSRGADDPWQPNPEQVIEFPEPMRLAEHYLARRHTLNRLLTLRRYGEKWWKFEHGGYRELPDEIAVADIYRHVDRLWTPVRDPDTGEATGTYTKLVARSSTVSEVARAISACGAIVDGAMPRWLDDLPDRPTPADMVAFRNGLLDTSPLALGREPRLMPLTPAWFSGVACPFDYDPLATCPLWRSFLDGVLDGDADSIALLQEWFGLNLVPDNQYERFMMYAGPPRGGKGTALEVMGAMLGEGQCASTSFAKLASRFGLAPLVGRLSTILPDAHVSHGTDAKAALEVIKSVTGNDPQAIDRKGIDELPRVRLFCRFSIAVNELPKLPDEAGALKTRLLLLHFRKSFAGREDTGLKTRLKTEAPGVAVWALEGLKRLRTNGRFTVPQRSDAMIQAFEQIVSPVLRFLDECCELSGGDESVWTEKDLLYAAWCTWSEERGSDPGSKADFGQALLNANKGIAAARRGPRGSQFAVYTGVRTCS
jgi:putative DNA primase/helicase